MRILALGREVDGIKDMFREAQNNQVLGNFPVFKKGEQYYFELLDLNLPKVIQEVEADLERAKAELARLTKIKEEKTKDLIKMFEETMASFQLENNHRPRLAREEAVKTMRKLPVFGYNNNGTYKPDYEWPTAEDIMAMPEDQPVKAAAINWKKCD